MEPTIIERMRGLRRRARHLNKSLCSDLKVFLHPYDKKTFMRLPSIGPDPKNKETDIGVTVTCTGLMTLAVTQNLEHFYFGEQGTKEDITSLVDEIFEKFRKFKWTSSLLPENNAFTVSLILRAAGILCHSNYAEATHVRKYKREKEDREPKTNEEIDAKHKHRRLNGMSLEDIAKLIADDASEYLKVLEYPATPAIAYWFFEAVDELDIELEVHQWEQAAEWIGNQFTRQLSLISAQHDALMDPIALAMSACLCKRMQSKAERTKSLQHSIIPRLPSETELRNGVRVFIKKQSNSGIWPKYFPLFHYPGAGANHCWSFEVLEAILNEFEDITEDETVLGAMENAVAWCENYRLTWLGTGWREDNVPFKGWNSGGQQKTLQAGEPESWATGVVHMFLHRLRTRLSNAIRKRILAQYEVEVPQILDKSKWESNIVDADLVLRGENPPRSLKTIVKENILDIVGKMSSDEIRLPEGTKRSALLFGPPGTGKTSFVKAIASAIGWEYLTINPSAFLSQGLGSIYVQANELFRDLRDLHRTVVLFDEMDAMVQTRDAELEVEQQFLTTSMLPHLADLYNENKILFFVATNHKEQFDDAVIRPGRFDMLLYIGPPTWQNKLDGLGSFVNISKEQELESCRTKLSDWIPTTDALASSLDLATIGEMKALLGSLCGKKPLDLAIREGTLTRDQFRDAVTNWKDTRFSLCDNGHLKAPYKDEKLLSEIR